MEKNNHNNNKNRKKTVNHEPANMNDLFLEVADRQKSKSHYERESTPKSSIHQPNKLLRPLKWSPTPNPNQTVNICTQNVR